MTVNQIFIQGYRGFQSPGQVEFAAPNGKYGSGLTILTGPNNSGKSTVLECLKIRSQHNSASFTSGTRNRTTDHVEIRYIVNGKEESLVSAKKGGSETVSKDVDPNEKIFVLQSRRAFNPYFSKGEASRDNYVQQGVSSQRSPQLSGFEYRLFTILKNQDAFNVLLKEVLGYLPTWNIDQNDQGQYFLKFFNGQHSHSSDGMGEGVVSVFSIVDSLYDSKPGDVIVIDEPELSLHPSLQKRLSSLIGRFSSDRQIVLSTHSPYFVDLYAMGHGANLVRVVTGESGTQIHQLGISGKAAIAKLCSANLYNPHVFGLDAKELFFLEDRIILTEGQEDVLLYPKVALQLGIALPGSFFGWGAGGAANIKYLCQILHDLGFKKVAAIFDGDKVDTARELEKSFKEYVFLCIPALDIRTKKARKATDAVDGLLDENLTLKTVFVPPLTELFGVLAKAFN